MSVDLPEPEGPITAMNSLRSISMSTPRSAYTISAPMSYSLRRPWVTMTV
jgi:hypothetical protein